MKERDYKQRHEMQEQMQGSSSDTAVSEQWVQEIQQVAAQCVVNLVAVQAELEGLRTKISAPMEWLEGESRCLCWGPIGCGIHPKACFGA